MIQQNFDRASNSYEKVAFIQKQVAEHLVNKLKQLNISHIRTILDLGTGTGYMPELLSSTYCNAKYFLNDISNCMLDICKVKFACYSNRFQYINCDMEKLDFQQYDLIVSNLSMQWVKDIYSLIHNCLKHSKVFMFSTLLYGTFEEWQKLIYEYENTSVLKKYPTESFLASKYNFFEYGTQEFQITFDSPLQFLYYLKDLGAMSAEKSLHLKTLKKLIQTKEPLSITYRVFWGIHFNNKKI